MSTSTAGDALVRMADAIDAQDWEGLSDLLADDFRARYCHTGEEFDSAQFVALNRDYPGDWRFVREVVVDGGTTAVLRARVSDAAGQSPEVHHVASFGTVDASGRLVALEEVWAEVTAPPKETAVPIRLSVGSHSVADMRHAHHSIDYVEIYVDDVAAAKTFFREAFGWQFNDYGDAYSGIQAPDGDGEVGGITVGDARGRSPLVLIISEDLDASLEAVRRAGGEVVEGPFDYPGGRRFHFHDPSGNVLGVFQPSDS